MNGTFGPSGMTHVLRAALLAILAGSLAGCMTAYQPRGMTGGYVDRKIDENTYHVSFFGNGHTPKERVYRFWLYRCAELTTQYGFDFFKVIGPRRQADGGMWMPAAAGSDWTFPVDHIERLRTVSSVPSVIYVPGGTITTWTARGYIRMYKGTADPDDPLAFDAKRVLADLGPETRDSGNNVAVKSGPAYDPARVFKPNDPDLAVKQETEKPAGSGGNTIGVDMDDLKGLLPAAEAGK